MKYDRKLKLNDNKKFNNESIEALNKACASHPNVKVAIEISSTKYLSSDLINKLPKNILIRVAGGYDEERVERNKNKIYDDGESGIFYEESVVYTKDELVAIVKEIEKIEAGYRENWSPIQKILYTYDKLKREIMYDPENEQKPTSEMYSLRGLVTKETICAGFSLIFKEIMDRNGIDCEYVEGYTKADGTGAHAWNIINLDGKKYPIDLTKDNAWFRAGKMYALDSFKEDITSFANEHFPFKEEKTQNYQKTLSKFNPEVIDAINEEIGKEKEYNNTTYYGTRKDGSKFIVTGIGNAEYKGRQYFRHYYEEILPDGERKPPIILYSENNLTALIYSKLFHKDVPDGYEKYINNVLFSKENIIDSLTKKSFYIGKIDKVNEKDEREFFTSYKEIPKPEEILKIFSISTKILKRKDGSAFVIQRTPRKSYNINGITIYEYDIVETITKEEKRVVKRNTIYSENDFFSDIHENIIDKYLSRDRIDTASSLLGGYLGYYNENSEIKYHQSILNYFKDRININIPHEGKTKKKTI